jgi:hypothetical protein
LDTAFIDRNDFFEKKIIDHFISVPIRSDILPHPKSLFLLDQEYFDVREVGKYRGGGVQF